MADRKHVVLLIHGIRTRAEWAQRTANVLEGAGGVSAKLVGYGFFDIVRFLLPIPAIRNAPLRRITRQVRAVLGTSDRQKPYISFIAHSFGTLIVSRLLQQEPDIKIHRLVLCGGVVPTDFQWEAFTHRLDSDTSGEWHAVNDCGMKDIWPVLADSVTWGYGASGRFGFQHVAVKDRFFNTTHSGYFEEDFVRKYWVPYISSGHIPAGLLPEATTPWIVSVLTVLRLRNILTGGLVLGVALLWALFRPAPYASLEKTRGDGQTITSSTGYDNFYVRATSSEGSPVANARVAWKTSYCGDRLYVSATDGTGTTSATNMCNGMTAGSHQQIAQLAPQDTPVGFRNPQEVTLLGSPVVFSFEFKPTLDSEAGQGAGLRGAGAATCRDSVEVIDRLRRQERFGSGTQVFDVNKDGTEDFLTVAEDNGRLFGRLRVDIRDACRDDAPRSFSWPTDGKITNLGYGSARYWRLFEAELWYCRKTRLGGSVEPPLRWQCDIFNFEDTGFKHLRSETIEEDRIPALAAKLGFGTSDLTQ